MKKVFSLGLACVLLTVTLLFSFVPTTVQAAGASSYVTLRIGISKAIVNGVQTTVDTLGTRPFKTGGRAMLPLRFISQKMGGTVKYVSDSKPITVAYKGKKVEFLLGSKKMTLTDTSGVKRVVPLDVAAQKKSGKTYIPLRAIGQALGFQVYYEDKTETIIVCTPNMSEAVKADRLKAAEEYFKSVSVLAGKIICLDPGHGTYTKEQASLTEPIAPGSSIRKKCFGGGATGVSTKVPEQVYVLNFAYKLKAALEEEGAVVIMTRTGEKSITSITRAEIANKAGAQATIRIHCDSNSSPSPRGATAYVASDKYVKDAALRKKSEFLARCLVDEHCAKTGLKNRGVVSYSDFTGLNWSKVPVTLFELGFMSNPEEDRLMATEEFQKNSIAGLISGLKKYFA